MKRIVFRALTILLLLGQLLSMVCAAELPDAYAGVSPRPLAEGETLCCGMDVSQWQGSIDWDAVAAAGVDFAFVRVGFRGYGAAGNMCADTHYISNLDGAKAAGLRIGAYFFSQATTEEEAVEEANYALSLLDGRELDLPIVIDFEYVSEGGQTVGRLYEAQLTPAQATAVVNAFCRAIDGAGYTSAVYANRRMLQNDLQADEFVAPVWLAQWNTETDYAGSYTFWQFTNNGSIPGINGRVDLDLWFCPSASSNNFAFSDVPITHWAHADIQEACAAGIVHGTGQGTFLPDQTITRGQFVTMLYNLAGNPEATATVTFTDLTAGYYLKAIQWAQENGIVTGYTAQRFGPDEPVTRQDMMTILHRYVGYPESADNLQAFDDAGTVAAYALPAFRWAVEQELIYGRTATTLCPWENSTRAEAAVVMVRFFRTQE